MKGTFVRSMLWKEAVGFRIWQPRRIARVRHLKMIAKSWLVGKKPNGWREIDTRCLRLRILLLSYLALNTLNPFR